MKPISNETNVFRNPGSVIGKGKRCQWGNESELNIVGVHNFSCVLVARGSGGGMEKEKMPAGCQRSDGKTENLGKCGFAVHEFHELAQASAGASTKKTNIQTIIGI